MKSSNMKTGKLWEVGAHRDEIVSALQLIFQPATDLNTYSEHYFLCILFFCYVWTCFTTSYHIENGNYSQTTKFYVSARLCNVVSLNLLNSITAPPTISATKSRCNLRGRGKSWAWFQNTGGKEGCFERDFILEKKKKSALQRGERHITDTHSFSTKKINITLCI